MRFYFDTEFIEDGKTIDLLSIGIVSEDGREYYAECADTDRTKANDWVRENVLFHLTKAPKTKEQIRREILEFIGSEKPEFWAYYADYDWVVLCQLFGRMIDLPKGWPMYCRDLKQELDRRGNPRFDIPRGKDHHALDDAKWVMATAKMLAAII